MGIFLGVMPGDSGDSALFSPTASLQGMLETSKMGVSLCNYYCNNGIYHGGFFKM
jgi:hypothetical protein